MVDYDHPVKKMAEEFIPLSKVIPNCIRAPVLVVLDGNIYSLALPPLDTSEPALSSRLASFCLTATAVHYYSKHNL